MPTNPDLLFEDVIVGDGLAARTVAARLSELPDMIDGSAWAEGI